MTPVGAAGIGSVVLALTLAASPADEDGMRVHRWFGPVLRSAIAGAAVRLADPDCAGLLASFRDGEGRLLRENLERLSVEQLRDVIHQYRMDPAARTASLSDIEELRGWIIRAVENFGIR